MTNTRGMSADEIGDVVPPSEAAEQRRWWKIEQEYAEREQDLLARVDEERARLRLWDAIVNSMLIMGGVVGAAGLLYFRAQVWAWATGDPVTFVVVLVMLAVGSLLTIRAAQGR